MARGSILNKVYNSGPLILLYYLCISEIDTNLEKVFNFNLFLGYKKTRNYGKWSCFYCWIN